MTGITRAMANLEVIWLEIYQRNMGNPEVFTYNMQPQDVF